MIYTINSGAQKDVLEGDVVEIQAGVMDGVSALVVTDVSDSNIVGCARINFDNMQISDPVSLSPSWITQVWRPV